MLATVNLNYVQHPDTGELTVIGDKAWCSQNLHPNDASRVHQSTHR
jgi:hypothetical protein